MSVAAKKPAAPHLTVEEWHAVQMALYPNRNEGAVHVESALKKILPYVHKAQGVEGEPALDTPEPKLGPDYGKGSPDYDEKAKPDDRGPVNDGIEDGWKPPKGHDI